MIEKLLIVYPYPDIKEMSKKINEIIDYLPQEKCICEYIKGFNINCPVHKQPTKEVPDIRPILEKLLDGYDGIFARGTTNEGGELIDQAIQEISALYRKEK